MNRKTIVLVHGGSGGAGFASAGDKLFHPVLGRPLVSYVLDAAAGLRPSLVALALEDAGRESETDAAAALAPAAGRIPFSLIRPKGRRGWTRPDVTSVLLASAATLRKKRSSDILVVPADRPLLQAKTLRSFLAAHRRRGCALTIMTCGPDIDRDSVAAFRAADIVPLLPALARAKGETGLRFLAALLSARGRKVGLTEHADPAEASGVLGRADLARAARLLQRRKNERLSRHGVTLLDPLTTWIDWAAEVGSGTVVYPSVVIEGATRVGRNCRIYPYVHIMDSRILDRVRILSSTVLDGCRLEEDAQVGPFSRLRPGTVVRAASKVGNFVEMKNTVFGPRSKAQHLSYLGDTLVEEDVNVGAGTITCNYDGVRKSRTHIGDGAFIGSGTELVAPVTIGKGAYVAAGSTITKDVGPASLAISRARQVEKPGWVLERMKSLRRKKHGPK
jgi:bifunctional UDP-N-acetylglucosamine pyrophosphorylase/glucosamine-1-phosphate N-acetyltransferase